MDIDTAGVTQRRRNPWATRAGGLSPWLCLFLVAAASAEEPLTIDSLRLGPEFESRLIETPTGQLSCYRRAGSGPALAFIPGTFSDAGAFALMVPRLPSDLDLIVIEHRGVGKSWPPPADSSIESCARDAFAILDALAVQRCYVGGHSLGGMISLEMGRQQSARLQGIISIEGWTNASAAAAFQNDMKSTLTPAQQTLLADSREKLLRNWSADQIKLFGQIWRRWDGSEFLKTTTLPVLELYGDRNRPRPEPQQLGLPENPAVRLTWFAGASHSLLIERPEGVAQAITGFLAETTEGDLEAEVVVFSGTPGGIAAAIAAARFGRKVILIEPQAHLGGMMASGLGKSDIEHRELIGGLFREFTAKVREEYVRRYGESHENVRLCQDGYYYEPSVAERVLDAMLNESHRITVLREWNLTGAQVSDDQVTTVTMEHRTSRRQRTIRGRVFVDATYEGDLFAAAGAGFRLGREGRDEFQEPHAGVVYFDYQERQFLPGSTGEADDRLPAYTYRLCLTTDPDNAVPLTAPPEGYDRRHYLGYFDDLHAGRLAGPKVFKPGRGYNPSHFNTLVRALSVTELPNRKTDVNVNPRPLGFPFAELNRGYVDGDEATRERIRSRHRQLTLGLLWFLQTDDEVPEPHRKLAKELHLPKDEFVDTGHFPFQLYVREARRLKGVYTLSERDITKDAENRTWVRPFDSIAVGEFPIDSFPCRARKPGDTKVLEGYLGMLDSITRPYEIPYRIMIPEKLNGLIVPVAASTTHVAYSSIRMEPTWMALGQAAGTAADIALRRQAPLRSVPIAELQHELIQQRQVIHHDTNPETQPMLAGTLAETDPQTWDFGTLPKIPGELTVVNSVRVPGSDPAKVDKQHGGVNQHNYLVRHRNQFWIMWSDGPGVEDRVGQRVKFAASPDGLKWEQRGFLTPDPPGSGPTSEFYGQRTANGFRWIARGFWQRDGELLALASLDEAGEFFGPSLSLRAFAWNDATRAWDDRGVIAPNTINNFPPERLPNGQWMMSRRPFDYRTKGVHFLVGGTESPATWESFPVLGSDSELAAEEPLWWVLPDGRLLALFRDNRRSGFIYRSFSRDQGRTWTVPSKTNFPDATSKLHGLRLRDGRYVLVSNANPKKRDPLTIAVSHDGVTFHQLGYLVGKRHIDYPHVLEHEGHLLVAFSGGKQSVEVLKISLDEATAVLDRAQPRGR